MGLDMYLKAKIGVSGYEFIEEQERIKFNTIKDIFPEADIENNSIIYIELPIGYWRKANAIHRWFVENIQEGIDDCGNYYVSRGQLKTLKTLCEDSLQWGKYRNPSEEPPLKTQSGFFFGSTDYDEWYIADLKDTIKIIDKCLALSLNYDFYYSSSW